MNFDFILSETMRGANESLLDSQSIKTHKSQKLKKNKEREHLITTKFITNTFYPRSLSPSISIPSIQSPYMFILRKKLTETEGRELKGRVEW